MTDEAPDLVAVNRTFHDHECAYYDERFAIVHDAASARRALAEIQQLLGRSLRPGDVVVDVGCGTGWLAAGLRRARPDVTVVGSDLSTGMLSRARLAGGRPLVQADATVLPLAAASVDVIVCRGVLHHLPEVVRALREWRRVLRPNGAVVLSSEPTPAVEGHGAVLVRVLLALLRRPLTAEEDFWEVASMAANLHVFTVADIDRLAREAGFTRPVLRTADWLSTMVLTASYVTHGRRPGVARRLPWRRVEAIAARLDALVVDRLLPPALRHTVVGRLEP
ncbi:MAG TPA: class I SAM-dependent methyltransferase [Mycobacteriales bacterium]